MDTLHMDELWDVRLDNGSSLLVTLDQLDAAFQAGQVHERTLVRQRGTEAWQTLAVVAGIEEAPPAPVFAPHSLSPQVFTATPSGPYALPSLSEIDLDNPAAFKSSKKKVFAVIGIGAALLATVGFIALRGGDSTEPTASAAVAAPPPPAAQALPVAPKVEAPPSDRLSDDQKRALMQADKKKDAHRKQRVPAAGPAPRTGRAPSSGPVFHKGGNKYDPLNSNL